MVKADTSTYGYIIHRDLDMFRALRDRVGGKWTVNQLIVAFHVLYDNAHDFDCTVGHIADREGMSQSSVSNAAIALNRAGWIVATLDPEDARRSYLRASDKLRKVTRNSALFAFGACWNSK